MYDDDDDVVVIVVIKMMLKRHVSYCSVLKSTADLSLSCLVLHVRLLYAMWAFWAVMSSYLIAIDNVLVLCLSASCSKHLGM